jgi:hypothetical protein
MNSSGNAKIHSFTGHKDKEFRVEYEETDAIYLNMEEIERIYNLKFTEELLLKNGFTGKSNNLQRAIVALNEERDRFLLYCPSSFRLFPDRCA